MTSPFINEAVRIGDQLLELAEQNNQGISWPFIEDTQRQPSWHQPENLYSGVSGISLFFIELYAQTHNKTYLEAAEKSMAWVEWYCDHHPSHNYAFLSGRVGIAYVFLKLYQATNNQAFLQKALVIAKQSKDHIPASHEYMNGISGTVLGLLHLHAASHKPWLLDIINDYVHTLINSIRLGQAGIYWDRDYPQIRPLCGFSHGVAGVGFVFLELGRYFDSPTFYLIADQAFAYENAWFNPDTGNWPDFRLYLSGESRIKKLEKQYEAEEVAALITPSDMNAWCNGAAGIALSRLRAYKLTGNKSYQRDLMRAVTKIDQTGAKIEAGLCHGSGGNADCLIEGYRLLHDKQLLQHAQRFGETVLRHKQRWGHYRNGIGDALEDPSLFKGLAGIGYFFLRLHSQGEVPSILAPTLPSTLTVPSKDSSFLSLNESALYKSILNNTFPRTIELLEDHAPQLLNKYVRQAPKGMSGQTAFVQLMQTMITESTEQRIKDMFSLELLKLNLDHSLSSGLLYIKNRVVQKRAEHLLRLTDDALLHQSLVLAEECRLFANHQNEYFLLQLTGVGVEERKVSQFCFVVLQAFTKPTLVRKAVKNIAQLYKVQDKSERMILNTKILAQLREAIANTIIGPIER